MPVPSVPTTRYTASRRHFELLVYLDRGRGVYWLHRLAERFGVTARTIRRDLGFLVSLGAEIETSGIETEDLADIRSRVFFRRPPIAPELPTITTLAYLSGMARHRSAHRTDARPARSTWRPQESNTRRAAS